MTFQQALEAKQKNMHLIGQKYRGATIEDVVVAPIDPDEWGGFMRTYILSDYNGNVAIRPYVASNVRVVAFMDRDKIDDEGVLLVEPLEVLSNSLIVH